MRFQRYDTVERIKASQVSYLDWEEIGSAYELAFSFASSEEKSGRRVILSLQHGQMLLSVRLLFVVVTHAS